MKTRFSEQMSGRVLFIIDSTSNDVSCNHSFWLCANILRASKPLVLLLPTSPLGRQIPFIQLSSVPNLALLGLPTLWGINPCAHDSHHFLWHFLIHALQFLKHRRENHWRDISKLLWQSINVFISCKIEVKVRATVTKKKERRKRLNKSSEALWNIQKSLHSDLRCTL